MTGITYPSGLKVTYGYDGVGRLSSVSSNLSGAATLANSFLYQPATDLGYAWRHGNGVPRLVSLDQDGRVTNLNGGSVFHASYGYLVSDTLQSITDHVVPGLNASHTFDANDLLETVSRTGDAQSFDWDLVGNRTGHMRGSQAWGLSHHLGSNTIHQVTASGASAACRTLTYDAVGNVGRDQRATGVQCYGYDGFNRKAAVYFSSNSQATCSSSQPLVGCYKSNALNQRAWKWTLGGTTH